MIRRFFRYVNKVFHLPQLLKKVGDGREQPQIPGQSVWLSAVVMFVLRLGSLNALEETLKDPKRRAKWTRLLGHTPPSADAIGYFAERVDCDSLRGILHDLYTRLQRNRHLGKFRIGGWAVLAIDGHELFSSYRLHCDECSARAAQTKQGERIQYYHRIVVAQLVAGPIPILLDAEAVQPHEDEDRSADFAHVVRVVDNDIADQPERRPKTDEDQ